MSEKKRTALLLCVFVALLVALAYCVPNGKLSDEADERYHEEQLMRDENSWVLNY